MVINREDDVIVQGMYKTWKDIQLNEKEKKSTVNKSGNYTKPGMRKIIQ